MTIDTNSEGSGDLDFLDSSIVELATAVRQGQITARALTDHALSQIDKLNPTIGAFVAVDADAARANADRIDNQVAAGTDPGPLAGIPFGVKDLEDAAGYVTTFGSALHANDAPATEDSVLVARLKAAGAVVVGKTNTPEFGHKATTDNPIFPATVNPWNTAETPGGSSGGTTAALASGMVPMATGSDGGGSIRIPASLCGLTALKCQQGRIGTRQLGNRPSMLLSVRGPMARTAADTAWALDSCKGPHWADAFSLPPDTASWYDRVVDPTPPRRVVWSPTMGFADDVDPTIARMCRSAVDGLAAAGVDVVEDDSVFDLEPLRGWATNWFVYFNNLLGRHRDTPEWEQISESLRPMIELGASVSGSEAADAVDRMHARNADVGRLLTKHDADAILCPTFARLPPTLAELAAGDGAVDWVRFTFGINMSRHPAGSVCVGIGDRNLPVGLQVIGSHFDEVGVLSTMAAIETMVDPLGRPPIT